jgi:glycosyltransferase involved in cell wall biosynthesis
VAEVSFCLVATFFPPAGFGGDAVHVQQLAHGLARRGHRVRVVHNPTAYNVLARPEERKSLPGARFDGDVEVVTLPATRAKTAISYLTGRPTGFRGDLEQLVSGFDVVHFHNASLVGGVGAFGLGTGVRLYTTHEHWLLCPTHTLFRYRREVCTERTCARCCLSYHRPPQLWRSGSLLERNVVALDALLAPSRFTAALHAREFPDARVEVLPLPAPNIEGLHGSAPASAATTRPFFLFAGRLDRIKGADRLIRAFAACHGADLLVAGDGPDRALVEQVAARNPRVRLLGRISHEEVLARARDALAVVVPSVGYETFGGVALEAMAVGTMAVVRDLGPLPELVEDGGGVTFRDDADLTRTLQQLVDDPELVHRHSTRAREVATTRFSETKFLERYFTLIGEAATRTGQHAIAQRVESAGSSIA